MFLLFQLTLGLGKTYKIIQCISANMDKNLEGAVLSATAAGRERQTKFSQENIRLVGP
jgi:hypothetical protein